MQDNLMGKPCALKQVNLSLVRKAITEKGTATRAEIVEATKISVTTVRMLLTEMMADNELIEVGFDNSIGGRKARRYKLNSKHFFGVSLCFDNEDIRYLTVDINGDICDTGAFPAHGDATRAISDFLDKLTIEMEIRSIGIGVPGIVNGLQYVRKNATGELVSCAIGEVISQRYNLPVILENDLNAIALGFGRSYLKKFPQKTCEHLNIAYIHFDADCLSCGFLSNGQMLRGWNNFVGELGLFPVDSARTLDDLLASQLDDNTYSDVVSRLIAMICCVLNPEYVALGGTAFRADCLPLIMANFDGSLPAKMSAKILYAENKWQDYFEGMAHLTAEQIFANVKLVR